MKAIRVKAAGPNTGNVVFDHPEAGVVRNRAGRAVVRANGTAVLVNGALKVVKDAIERGDLIALDVAEPEPPAPPSRAEK